MGGFTEYIYQKTEFNEKLKQYLDSKQYTPTIWLPLPWLKIFYRLLKNPRPSPFTTTATSLADGSTLNLQTLTPKTTSKVTLIIIPDVLDSHDTWYVIEAAQKASSNHWRSVVFPPYASVPSSLSARGEYIKKLSHLSDIESKDGIRLSFIGFGQGASTVQMFLADIARSGGELNKIVGAVAVGPILQADKTFLKWDASWLLTKMFLGERKKRVLKEMKNEESRKTYHEAGITEGLVSKINYNTEFDFRVSCPLSGIKYLDEYYKSISDTSQFKHIKTPLLTICSRHDPVIE